jgi:FtsP/CotA-like multicopper oxidase with cupredoxin domain
MYTFGQLSAKYVEWIVFICAGLLLARSRSQMYPQVNYTGIVEYYTLVIRREILPGKTRYQVTMNGSIPGPALYVTLGNTVSITVINEMFDDVTGVHWHGMHLRGNPWADGVMNITQCPISNVEGNNSLTYTFTPDMPGTFWYHGHLHSQYPDGK